MDGEPCRLRPPRKNSILLGLSALVPAALLGAFTLTAWNAGRMGTAGLVGGIVATLVPVAVAAWLFARAARAHVVVHDLGMERVGAVRRRLVSWNAVSKISFNPANHWFFVTARDGSHLWLPADIPGMGEFAILALRRLPPAVLQAAHADVREVLEELAQGAREEARGGAGR